MECLITGASSFTGGHLVELLEEKGHTIRKMPREVYMDTDKQRILFDNYQPDYIFHLAAFGSQRGQTDPGQIVASNLLAPISLLDRAKKGIVLCGSSSEYGRKTRPMSERDSLSPETAYAGSKAALTLLAQSLAKQLNLPIAIARPFSLYGPGEKDNRFIPTVIRSCITGEAIKINKEQNHDWTFIKDFCDGLYLLAELAHVLKGEVVNFGTGTQMTNMQIVDIIQEMMGKKANIVGEYPANNHDSEYWEADITKAQSLGWFPQTRIVRGLSETIKFYEDKYRAA